MVNLIEPLYLLIGGYYNEGLWLLSVCVQMLTFLCSMVLLILICSNNFRYNWIVILLMPLIALFISWCLFLLINTITTKVLWAETFEEVTKVKSKKEIRHKIKHSSNTIYNLYITSKTVCDHPVHVAKETFERVNENDTIITPCI